MVVGAGACPVNEVGPWYDPVKEVNPGRSPVNKVTSGGWTRLSFLGLIVSTGFPVENAPGVTMLRGASDVLLGVTAIGHLGLDPSLQWRLFLNGISPFAQILILLGHLHLHLGFDPSVHGD